MSEQKLAISEEFSSSEESVDEKQFEILETNFSKPSGKSNSSSNNTGESEKENAMGTIEVNENVVDKKDNGLQQVTQLNKFVKIQKTKEHAFGFVLRGSKSKF